MKSLLLLIAITLTASAQTEKPLTSFPYTPGLDVTSMDKTADPCVDFYQYSCGGWMKNNPIPADQARWSVYGKLTQDNQRFLWGILDSSRRQSERPQRQPAEDRRLLRRLHGRGCRREARRQAAEAVSRRRSTRMKSTQRPAARCSPAAPSLETDDGFSSASAPTRTSRTRTQVIAFADAGGLGLPDRDYYIKTDAKSVELAQQVRQPTCTNMFELLGDKPGAAKAEAARGDGASRPRWPRRRSPASTRRDPYKLFHKMDFKPAAGADARLRLDHLHGAHRAARAEHLQRHRTGVLQGTRQAAKARSASTTSRPTCAGTSLHAAAPYLSTHFVNENSTSSARRCAASPQLRPRWKRCVQPGRRSTRRGARPGIRRPRIHAELKARPALDDAGRSSTRWKRTSTRLDWMSPATKKQALDKAARHRQQDRLSRTNGATTAPSRSSPTTSSATWSVPRTFESKRELAKIGKPLDRAEWGMTPPTVNAYYNPQMNDINFPAGVLQPPLYDPKMDDAPNYGNTGGTIGHELTHGFDDEGRQFDAQGNLKDWWTKEDAKNFTERAQCVVDQYAQYTVVDDIKINSKLTQGEDIADLGGLILAWMAWKAQTRNMKLAAARRASRPSSASSSATRSGPARTIAPRTCACHAITDPHSPGKYRVNGLVVNMPEFQKAFCCKAGQPMVP